MDKIYLVLEQIMNEKLSIEAKGDIFVVTRFNSLQEAYHFVRESPTTRQLAKMVETKIIEQ